MIAGGIVSGCCSDTVLAVTESQSSSVSQAYEEADFVVALLNEDGAVSRELFRYPYEDIAAGTVLDIGAAEQDISVRVIDACLNCDIILRDEGEQEGWVEAAASMKLIDKAPDIQPENNLQGVSFEVDAGGQSLGKYLTFDSFPKPPKFENDNNTYVVYVERRPYHLPFEVKPKIGIKIDYPGLIKRAQYESDVIVSDDEESFPAHISMNKPLRYQGYTLYQSSFSLIWTDKRLVFLPLSRIKDVCFRTCRV